MASGRPARTLPCLVAALKIAQDDQLLRSVQKHGRNWKAIRDRRFPGRSRNDVKNRHTILIRRGLSSTSATFPKQHALEIESDEDEDQNRGTDDRDNDDDDDEEAEEDDDDEDDGDKNNNTSNNTNNDDDDHMLKAGIGYAFEASGQDTMDLDQYLTPFSPLGFSVGTTALTPPEHAFSHPLSMGDAMHLNSTQTEHHYPFAPISNGLDLLAASHIDSTVSNAPWSFPSVLTHTESVPEDSMLSQPMCQPQPPAMPTYRRVTLVLEDYEKGLMDQLLQIVSTSQGKSQIEILP